jgi:hypothetical protein
LMIALPKANAAMMIATEYTIELKLFLNIVVVFELLKNYL